MFRGGETSKQEGKTRGTETPTESLDPHRFEHFKPVSKAVQKRPFFQTRSRSAIATSRFTGGDNETHEVFHGSLENTLFHGSEDHLELLRITIRGRTGESASGSRGVSRFETETYVAQVKWTMRGRAASLRYKGRNLLSM